MPSLKSFQVQFDRPNAAYMAGEQVSGKIIVNVSRDTNVRRLYFSARGGANVCWSQSQSRKDANGQVRTVHSNFTNSEEYLHLQYNIAVQQCTGRERPDSLVRITSGYHEYPFTFQLPHSIPSSFEHYYGHIRYTVKAMMDRPWKFNHECKTAFTVISPLDLNEYRARCLGIQDEVVENFCCLCVINQGSIRAEITMPFTGYVPGQSINTILDYKNSSSSVEISKVTTKLAKKIDFYANSPYSKTQTSNAVLKSTSDSGPFSARGRVVSNILVPPIPPSHLKYCSIINLEYQVIVTVHVSGPHCKIEKSYPLLIGTVPLYCPPSAPPMEDANVVPVPSVVRQNTPVIITVPLPMTVSPEQFNAPYPQTGAQNRHMGFVHPDQPSTSAVNLEIPPPSYEECMSGTEHIKESNDSSYVFGANRPFAPRYPVFNYPTQNIRNE
ncbi:PREDICTED: arrestin domain-containing protein 3-like isoform X1 [Eufriesea mexicana]|uniref:arrestin domain-containing protein 3-like isoform X1 n=1 Tax=Eufriesea mexicana TaxID=516756 RepID=UPI00083C8CF5|nr:PREDICTED: arrestin domain-containing protein 3-like isoform X1 [Eufriesea mexicana]